jgi:hypothetical protein
MVACWHIYAIVSMACYTQKCPGSVLPGYRLQGHDAAWLAEAGCLQGLVTYGGIQGSHPWPGRGTRFPTRLTLLCSAGELPDIPSHNGFRAPGTSGPFHCTLQSIRVLQVDLTRE